jgi:hypothetical protein
MGVQGLSFELWRVEVQFFRCSIRCKYINRGKFNGVMAFLRYRRIVASRKNQT